MACLKQYLYAGAAVTAVVGGAAAILGSGIVEAGSLGAATPAVLATTIAGIATTIGGLAACVATGMDLGECLEQAGKAEEAAKVRQHVAALQQEHDRMVTMLDRVKALAGA